MRSIKLIVVLVFIIQSTFAQWSMIHNDSLFYECSDLHFLNKDTGFVSGQIYHGRGFVLKTTDGGNNWTSIDTILGVCTSIYFINDSVGFTGGQDGIIHRTVNNGLSWDFLTGVSVWNLDFDELYFVNDSIGFIKTHYGKVFKTIDGGYNWTEKATIQYGSMFGNGKSNPFFFFKGSVGFAVGHGVYKTIDYGENWIRQNADTLNYYKGIHMIDEFKGFVVGHEGVILSTIDGGANWTISNTITTEHLNDIQFINDTVGYCVGYGIEFNNDTSGVVLYTIDCGVSWNRVKLSNNSLQSLQFVNDSIGYITGSYGEIFKINNANSYFTSIHKLVLNCQIKEQIIPNPVDDNCNVILKSDSKEMHYLKLFDIQGKLISEYDFKEEIKIHFNKLSSGLYIYTITNDLGYYSSGKIIKK
ncbi:MAG: T9SS type A sorting domain-containing protein [Bacteroidetes bacterium]|nr:T9SS type A sorting domain-containing protein [Bacteroidota bacterium]